MDLQYLFASLDGRINRAKWWAGMVILAIVSLVINFIIQMIFGRGFFGGFLVTLLVLALFYPSYAVSAKRFQDRDRPGKTALYGLVPVLIANLLHDLGAHRGARAAERARLALHPHQSRRRPVVPHRSRHPQGDAGTEPFRGRPAGGDRLGEALNACARQIAEDQRFLGAASLARGAPAPSCSHRWRSVTFEPGTAP